MNLVSTEAVIVAVTGLIVAFATLVRAWNRGETLDMPDNTPSDPPNETCPFCGTLVSTNVVGSVVAHRNHQRFCTALAENSHDV